MPFLFAGIMSAWTVAYGAYRKKRSVHITAATGQKPGLDRVSPAPPEVTKATDLDGVATD